MMKSRRQFLKIASLSFFGAAMGQALPGIAKAAEDQAAKVAMPAHYRQGKEALTAKHWGMVIDTRAFDSQAKFDAVIEACHSYHNVPTKLKTKKEIKWIWTDGYRQTFTDQMDNYPASDVLNRKYLMLCNHCANPVCVRVCPTKATFQRPDGIVVMDYHRCIGCRFCMAGCPFGARSFNFEDPRPFITEQNQLFPTRMRGVVEKCTFCSELLAVGKMPLCVEASEGAIVFGDLDDPASEVRQVLAENFTIRRKPTLGTEPSVYYII
ncbi:4Fe-4S dicluster domain-containing protein [Desulfovibrio sp. OttesenSCG-928-M16]|nr:4Fe-4S dicluster domain-containing protein [Desulfovibrio sp. OttesenSCG-928-M16]